MKTTEIKNKAREMYKSGQLSKNQLLFILNKTTQLEKHAEAKVDKLQRVANRYKAYVKYGKEGKANILYPNIKANKTT